MKVCLPGVNFDRGISISDLDRPSQNSGPEFFFRFGFSSARVRRIPSHVPASLPHAHPRVLLSSPPCLPLPWIAPTRIGCHLLPNADATARVPASLRPTAAGAGNLIHARTPVDPVARSDHFAGS
jgi:hypothetical protein